MQDPSSLSRRRFLQAVAHAAAGTAIAPLGLAHANAVATSESECAVLHRAGFGFGPLAPQLPLNHDELSQTVAGDLSQTPLLELPAEFSYNVLSVTGDVMSDGSLVPGDPDGMACFNLRRGRHLLVRNHELHPGENEFGNRAGVQPANGMLYDPFNLPPGQAGGGTTTVVVDRHGRLSEQVASLGGTSRNCAGGPTPWGSWISCEEDVRIPFTDPLSTRRHGYCFEVPAYEEPVEPIPIIAAGRFNHEAVAVDPETSIVYETEDRGDSCFYRYVSNRRASAYGHLQEGGVLEAMVIDANVTADCDGSSLPSLDQGAGIHAVDTRSHMQSFLGQALPVRWVVIDDVDPFFDAVRFEARNKGASLIERGEGAWYGRGRIYFVSTSGGDDNNGQVFAYDPWQETVTLVFESPSSSILDNPDNITVARDGTLYLCEDGGGSQFVVGIDRSGGVFPFVKNAFDTRELAGACFSPDHRFFFLNAQGVGITYAIFRDDRRPIQVRG